MVLRTIKVPKGGQEATGGLISTSPSNKSTFVLAEDVQLSIHPLASHGGLMVGVKPPRHPKDGSMKHVPCDIILVIDVSYSMSGAAPVVGFDEQGKVTREHPGLSVLDIAKHAALTVLETLDDSDRLGIVKFSDTAEIVQDLQVMSPDNKTAADGCIRALQVENSTNLWQGIVEGIKLLKGQEDSGRNPAILLLTDGQPNGHVPLQGYIGGVQSMLPLPAAIHTFGFGNDIKSDLLKSIAEIGGGNYSFIPDAGMVGTVFVNAVAYLQSTFANRCELSLTYGENLCFQHGFMEETTGSKEVDNLTTLTSRLTLGSDELKKKRLTIPLGNIHYGQSRMVYFNSDALDWSKMSNSDALDWFKMSPEELEMTVELRYSRMRSTQFVVGAQCNRLETILLPDWEVSYHQSRAMICKYLSSFFPLEGNGERKAIDLLARHIVSSRERFSALSKIIPAKDFDDTYNKSLIQDLEGQIKLAVFNDKYLGTWGLHFFLSLWDAHAKQMRNTFKDPGVQLYGVDSPLFLECQKRLAFAFDTSVRPPEPSLKLEADGKYSDGRVTVSMSWYNRSDNPCFSASSMLTLANGQDIPVSILRKGFVLQTAAGSRKVAVVLETRVREVIMCRVNKTLLITPWHPIIHKGSWTFPATVATGAVVYWGSVYSILLEPDTDAQAHTLRIGGVWATTLGHGVTSGRDARAHRFLGNYARVSKALAILGIGPDGVAVSSGVIRDKRSKRLTGFKNICPSSAQLEA